MSGGSGYVTEYRDMEKYPLPSGVKKQHRVYISLPILLVSEDEAERYSELGVDGLEPEEHERMAYIAVDKISYVVDCLSFSGTAVMVEGEDEPFYTNCSMEEVIERMGEV